MLIVETIRKVRQAHFRDGKGIREITRDFNLARNTVRNILRSGITDQVYERSEQPRPFPHEKGSQAINILITNTGTKLFFRTTDSSTADTLLNLIPEPHRQDRPHVVRVRPPSTPQPGECYYVLVNGSSGRGQVKVG